MNPRGAAVRRGATHRARTLPIGLRLVAFLGLGAGACGSELVAIGEEGSTTGEPLPPPVCGDGVVEGDEECDDGNTEPLDGCRANCTLEDEAVAARAFASGNCTCVVFEAGNVRCWGGWMYNGSDPLKYGAYGKACGDAYLHGYEITPGELGDLAVEGTFLDVVFAAGSPYGCLLREDGAVLCTAVGMLHGRGPDFPVYPEDPAMMLESEHLNLAKPALLGGPAVQVAVSSGSACAVMAGGALRCWGGNDSGQLGYGHTEWIGDDERPDEVDPVPLDGPVAQVVVWGHRTCARLVDGRVRCWGHAGLIEWPDGNDRLVGVLGLGPGFFDEALGDDEPITSVPAIDLPLPATDIALCSTNAFALLTDGSVYAWGGYYPNLGELDPNLGKPGYSTIGFFETPAQAGPVELGEPAVDVDCSCALLASGSVRCWGSLWMYPNPEKLDPVGDDETPASVPPIDLGGKAVALSSTDGNACALLEDGSLRCWGSNEYGELGYGYRTPLPEFGGPPPPEFTPAEMGPVPYR